MFDTMTAVKVGGGFCGALLVFLLANFAADEIYRVTPAGHGAGHGGAHDQAYAIAVPEGEEAQQEAASEGGDFATLYAAADAAAGEKVFGKCRACHKVDGSNATGPHLDGVVGRAVGSVAGFSYSSAMAGHGGDWTPEAMNGFLADPRGTVPGTKMSFAGLPKPKDRADLIAYLAGLGG